MVEILRKSKKFRKFLLIIILIPFVLIAYLRFYKKKWDFLDNFETDPIVQIIKIKKNDEHGVKACILILSREIDLDGLSKTIENFEDKFNSKYNYDYVILNDGEFSQQFKQSVQKLTTAKVKFGLVPEDYWSYPAHIDQEKAKLSRDALSALRIPKAKSIAYRFMCRFYSGFFFRHPLVQEYEYYMRLDAGNTEFMCDNMQDPFRIMKDGDYEYGFAIMGGDKIETMKTLWNETVKFMKKNSDLINPKYNSLKLVTDTTTNDYNRCAFYNNFEIGSFKFLRSDRYLKYFEHLEKAGGFFYERWGDAPVRTLAVAMFLPKSKIKFFDSIGYRHGALQNCPYDPVILKKCSCSPINSTDWKDRVCWKYLNIA